MKNTLTSIVKTLEKKYSTHTNPNFSLTHLVVLKIRIIIEFFYKSFLDFGFNKYEELRKLKNTIKEPVLILANGPSVNNYTVSEYQNLAYNKVKVFAVNWFALSELYDVVKPNFYVLSDPAFKNELKNKTSKFYKKLLELDSGTLLFIPSSWKIRPDLPVKIVTFNDKSLYGISKNLKPTFPRGYISLSAYKTIAIALYIGQGPIAIIGFDNTEFKHFESDELNQILLAPNKDRHFFSQQSELINLTTDYLYGMSDVMFVASMHFKNLWKFPKDRIFNLDKNSLTDYFKKMDLENFIKNLENL